MVVTALAASGTVDDYGNTTVAAIAAAFAQEAGISPLDVTVDVGSLALDMVLLSITLTASDAPDAVLAAVSPMLSNASAATTFLQGKARFFIRGVSGAGSGSGEASFGDGLSGSVGSGEGQASNSGSWEMSFGSGDSWSEDSEPSSGKLQAPLDSRHGAITILDVIDAPHIAPSYSRPSSSADEASLADLKDVLYAQLQGVKRVAFEASTGDQVVLQITFEDEVDSQAAVALLASADMASVDGASGDDGSGSGGLGEWDSGSGEAAAVHISWASMSFTLIGIRHTVELKPAPSPPPSPPPLSPPESPPSPPPSPPPPPAFRTNNSLAVSEPSGTLYIAVAVVFVLVALLTFALLRRRLMKKAAKAKAALEKRHDTPNVANDQGDDEGGTWLATVQELRPQVEDRSLNLLDIRRLPSEDDDRQILANDRDDGRRRYLAFTAEDIGQKVHVRGSAVVVAGQVRTIDWGNNVEPPNVSGVIRSVEEVENGTIMLRNGETLPNRHLRTNKLRHDGPGRERMRPRQGEPGKGDAEVRYQQTKAKMMLKHKLKNLSSSRCLVEPGALPKPSEEIMARHRASQQSGVQLNEPGALPKPSEEVVMRRRASLRSGQQLVEPGPLPKPSDEVIAGCSRYRPLAAIDHRHRFSRSGEIDVSSVCTSRPPSSRRSSRCSVSCRESVNYESDSSQADGYGEVHHESPAASEPAPSKACRAGPESIISTPTPGPWLNSARKTVTRPTTPSGTLTAAAAPAAGGPQALHTPARQTQTAQKRMLEIKKTRAFNQVGRNELPKPQPLPMPYGMPVPARLPPPQRASQILRESRSQKFDARAQWRMAVMAVSIEQCESAIKALQDKGGTQSRQEAATRRWRHAIFMLQYAPR